MGWKVFRFDRRTHWQHWSDKDRKHYQYGQFLHFSMAGEQRLSLMRAAASLPAVAQKAGCSSCQRRRRTVR